MELIMTIALWASVAVVALFVIALCGIGFALQGGFR